MKTFIVKNKKIKSGFFFNNLKGIGISFLYLPQALKRNSSTGLSKAANQ
jgi:hypothetical protein